MNIIEKDSITYLSYINNDFLISGASTRKTGISSYPYDSLNLGINTNDKPENISENRNRFFNTIAPGFHVCYLNQTHSNIIHVVDEKFKNGVEGDGLITNKKGLLLAATIADCGSVCFYDDEYTVAGIVHAGWAGTKKGIIEEICLRLSKYKPLHCFNAIIGPMIQSVNYEVGEEFKSYFDLSYFSMKNNSLYFDLNKCIENKLKTAGILKILNNKIDTYSNPDLYFSHRRDKITGRMLAFIALK